MGNNVNYEMRRYKSNGNERRVPEERVNSKEEKKSEDTYKTESFFVSSSSSSFAKFVFLKRGGVVCALQVLLLRSLFFLESHQGNVETR